MVRLWTHPGHAGGREGRKVKGELREVFGRRVPGRGQAKCVAAGAGECGALGQRRGLAGSRGRGRHRFCRCCKVLETSSPRKREQHWGMLDRGYPELTFIRAPLVL